LLRAQQVYGCTKPRPSWAGDRFCQIVHLSQRLEVGNVEGPLKNGAFLSLLCLPVKDSGKKSTLLKQTITIKEDGTDMVMGCCNRHQTAFIAQLPPLAG